MQAAASQLDSLVGAQRHFHQSEGRRPLRVLLSVYACAPNQGSEPGVGWNTAVQMARYCDVWAMTRDSNRSEIETELAERPVPGLHVIYHGLKGWPEKRQLKMGVESHYYLWQVSSISTAKRAHRQIRFDLTHHVTYVRYWMPTALASLSAPFLWGPVGGGESVPASFYGEFRGKERALEHVRDGMRWMGEHDPLVRRAARRSTLALATTAETAERLTAVGAQNVRVQGESALPSSDVERLERLPAAEHRPLRFISIGRLLRWKGFHLGLRAFAGAGLPEAEYWIVGDGAERACLQRLAVELGVSERVRFWGSLPRADVLERLGACHVLVHPSLHDSGGWVCLEAMAARRPVLCLNLGGPSYQVDESSGIKVPALAPRQVIEELSAEMRRVADEPEWRRQMGEAGHRRVLDHFSWDARARTFGRLYHELTAAQGVFPMGPLQEKSNWPL